MKQLAIIFAAVIIIINSITLYFVLRPRESVVRYRVATADIHDRSEMLQVSDDELRSIAEELSWVNVDAGLAARIAHMFVFSGEPNRLSQPYTVFYDEEHSIYIVLANIESREGVLRVSVCGRTGGVLRVSIGQRAWMPTYLPWP
ncbi:MAG: hypothetical protein FWC70_12135 [Defluviitaleaceae bacterium]|nr:hypothetical protein [Defluviitaleaceae bacterium]